MIAGSLMTCLLPMVEKVFNVQTDLSLIELGDPAHPLLQELIRRAPGHLQPLDHRGVARRSGGRGDRRARACWCASARISTTSAKCSSRATSSRTKGQGDNRHRSLVPAMSTLVIIAHVKDGADLARQSEDPRADHRLHPAASRHDAGRIFLSPGEREQESRIRTAAKCDESSFRYPGPKPQTKEAGILMLADAVESASRVLVEPTPARIESLVEDISRKRLLDGQFDECGLTLEEVRRDRRQSGEIVDGRLPRSREISGSGNGVSEAKCGE